MSEESKIVTCSITGQPVELASALTAKHTAEDGTVTEKHVSARVALTMATCKELLPSVLEIIASEDALTNQVVKLNGVIKARKAGQQEGLAAFKDLAERQLAENPEISVSELLALLTPPTEEAPEAPAEGEAEG